MLHDRRFHVAIAINGAAGGAIFPGEGTSSLQSLLRRHTDTEEQWQGQKQRQAMPCTQTCDRWRQITDVDVRCIGIAVLFSNTATSSIVGYWNETPNKP